MEKKFVIFYSADSDYRHFSVEASSLSDAEKTANAFALRTGAIIVGVFPERLLKMYCHE